MGKRKKLVYRYVYQGPVVVWTKEAARYWTCTTQAMSDAEAKRNIIARYKQEHGLEMNVHVEIDSGKIFKDEDNPHEIEYGGKQLHFNFETGGVR